MHRTGIRVSKCGCVHHPPLPRPQGLQAALLSEKGRESYERPVAANHSVVQENYSYLKEKLGEVCAKHGERVLETSHNPISLG